MPSSRLATAIPRWSIYSARSRAVPPRRRTSSAAVNGSTVVRGQAVDDGLGLLGREGPITHLGQQPRAQRLLELLPQVRRAACAAAARSPRPGRGTARSRPAARPRPCPRWPPCCTICGGSPSCAPSDSMDSISATTRSTPSRSALFTTKTSAISMIPAFSACTSSPSPGTSTTTLTSAAPTISTSSWPTPDRLHDDHVLARGGQDREHVRRGRGQPAQVPAGGHGADEHALVEGMGLHADAVAEDRAAGEGRRGIDGDDADRAPLARGDARSSGRRASTCRTPGGPVTPRTIALPACGKSSARRAAASGRPSSTMLMARATARIVAGTHAFGQRQDLLRGRPQVGYRTTPRRSSSSRAMTSRWTSLVPSPMVPSFESRRNRSTGYSLMKP